MNARLTQLRGEVRVRAHRASDGDYYRKSADDLRFRDDLANGESIVTNTGVQDDGSIDQRQDGENPPPFCMNGAIGTFRLELPPEQNHFDRQTISDVIVRVALTSRAGGEGATSAATRARRQRLADRPHPVMLPLHSAFSNVWHRFVDALAQDGVGDLALTFATSHIPLRLLPMGGITQSSLYIAVPNGVSLDVLEGTVRHPLVAVPELQPVGSSENDPHILPPIHRFTLREPLRLGEERKLRIGNRTGPAKVARGWLICWHEGDGEV